jgi:hypothetical protein
MCTSAHFDGLAIGPGALRITPQVDYSYPHAAEQWPTTDFWNEPYHQYRPCWPCDRERSLFAQDFAITRTGGSEQAALDTVRSTQTTTTPVPAVSGHVVANLSKVTGCSGRSRRVFQGQYPSQRRPDPGSRSCSPDLSACIPFICSSSWAS